VQKLIHDVFFVGARSEQKKWTFELIIIDKEINIPWLENKRIFKIKFPDLAEKRTKQVFTIFSRKLPDDDFNRQGMIIRKQLMLFQGFSGDRNEFLHIARIMRNRDKDSALFQNTGYFRDHFYKKIQGETADDQVK
jgi:hypothetical protein